MLMLIPIYTIGFIRKSY